MMPVASHSGTNSPAPVAVSQHYVLLGAKGAGMTALAEILADLGHRVTGFDKSLTHEVPATSGRRLIRLLPWTVGEFESNEFDLCVASPAIANDDRLLRELRKAGTPVLSLHECLAAVFADSHQICVAGTHGKSTTSAMLAWILDFAGVQPGFFVGAHQQNFNCSGRAVSKVKLATGRTKPFSVIESCEYSQSFHGLSPSTVVLTGIERDHFDCFPDQQSEDAAFQAFADKLPTAGHIVFDAQCVRSRFVADAAPCTATAFEVLDDTNGQNPDRSTDNWVAHTIRHVGRSTSFQLRNPGNESEQTVQLTIPGRHNVANATAAIVTATHHGVSAAVCGEALAEFRGIRRRFEMRGVCKGMTLVDDYAHHPTAIRATLQSARDAFPGRRIIAAFEPHQMVRTKALFPEFVNSLLLADEILLLPVFPARENVTHLECCRMSGKLVKEINNQGTRAFLFANLDQIVSRIDHSGRPNDIILTMGAGRTHLIHDQLTRRLQRHSVA